MTLYDRWIMAYESPMGSLLVVLFLLLFLLAAFYLALMYRQRSRDLMASLHRLHFEKSGQFITEQGWKFVGVHKADFFGRETLVKKKDQWGLCTIPTPDLLQDDEKKRFALYLRAFSVNTPSLATSYLLTELETPAFIQEAPVDSQGQFYPHLGHFVNSKAFVISDREHLLLRLAKDLSRLHAMCTDTGESLYHGWLLPKQFFIELDGHQRIMRTKLLNSGWAFAIGPDKLFLRLKDLQQGIMPLEKYAMQELVDFLPFLAPEQKNFKQLDLVGTTSDFYSFGMLATWILTKKKALSSKDVAWNQVALKWHPFLRACLEENPKNRPRDFMDLEDLLNDPEFSLTSIEEERIRTPLSHKAPSLNDLSHDLIKAAKGGEGVISNPFNAQSQDQHVLLKKQLDLGIKSVKLAKWKDAKKILKDILKLSPDSIEAHVQMAIVCYELEDFKSAEKHYETAKQTNPKLAKQFREHIAFKI